MHICTYMTKYLYTYDTDNVLYDSASVKSLQLCHKHPQKRTEIQPCIVTCFW